MRATDGNPLRTPRRKRRGWPHIRRAECSSAHLDSRHRCPPHTRPTARPRPAAPSYSGRARSSRGYVRSLRRSPRGIGGRSPPPRHTDRATCDTNRPASTRATPCSRSPDAPRNASRGARSVRARHMPPRTEAQPPHVPEPPQRALHRPRAWCSAACAGKPSPAGQRSPWTRWRWWIPTRSRGQLRPRLAAPRARGRTR